MSSSDAAGTEVSPFRVPTATGKNERKAASAHTLAQRGHSHPKRSILPLQDTTWGARAMRGTVWDMMTQGRMAREAMRQRAMSTASPIPTTPPMASPAAARRSVYQEYPATVTAMGEPPLRFSGSRSRATMSQVWGMARSEAFGMIRQPKTVPPSTGPVSL